MPEFSLQELSSMLTSFWFNITTLGTIRKRKGAQGAGEDVVHGKGM